MRVEWPTALLIIACYVGVFAAVAVLPQINGILAILCLIPLITLHASLQHEVIHGHPFGRRRWGEWVMFPSLNLTIPYLRFRETHLAHHMDAQLTDPYEDPESNYLAAVDWAKLPNWMQKVMTFNNTLLGRMLIGPLVSQVAFMLWDLRLIRGGTIGVLSGWLWHIPCVVTILALVALSPMPVWHYLIACYAALSVLKIRTFLEHQAHERARGRTVIIEDRGPLAFLFLNNNLHVVHHMHPKLPWYRLPALYRANREKYLARNEGYLYRSYADIFRQYFLRRKDPVPHPFFRQIDGTD